MDLKSLASRSFCHLFHCLPLLIIVREDESILSVVNTRAVQLDQSMALKDELSGLRRSRRRSVYTTCARQYKEGQNRPVFPSIGDEINVKWVWNEHPVWWPATVLSISNTGQKARRGELLYHKLGDYGSSQATVVFSLSSSRQRFVKSIDARTDSDTASWVYSDEGVSDEEGKSECEPSPPGSPRLNIQSRAIQRKRSTRPDTSTGAKLSLVKRSKSKRASTNVSNHETGSTVVKAEDELTSEEVGRNSSTGTANAAFNSGPASPDENMTVGLRLQLLERRLADLGSMGTSALSSTTVSVIASLRWALLRSLEKPLRVVLHPSLDQVGAAPQELVVTSQCDYQTFREIAAVLAKEHKCASLNPTKSRVAFSPAFHTTQSGSSACNNMNILFSCLADVTNFLRIRDESDFDSILSKEMLSDKASILRILGTFSVEDIDDGYGNVTRSAAGPSSSTYSVSASSQSLSVLRLFIGSSQLMFKEISSHQQFTNEAGDNSGADSFVSTIFQQECRHFCPHQKCFREPWTTKNIETKMYTNCSFDLDGTVDKEQLTNYFVLTWSRQAAPSVVKWTRDVHEVANNAPGCLGLSVPTVLFTSNRNVRSLVPILDNNIETFMKVRSKMHSLSSFK